MMLYGMISLILGVLISMVSFLAGQMGLLGIGLLMIFGGGGSVVGAIVMGLSHHSKMTTRSYRPEQEGRVMARYAINQLGEMLFDNFDYDAERARYYVKVKFLDGTTEELESSREVFDTAGEGMKGMLLMQGNWLSRFTPLADSEESRQMYKEL